MPITARQAVELFHLVFLAGFVAQEKERVALKGGCNLRFFLGSVRYSEDMDLDTAIAKTTLKNKVDRLLESPIVTAPLRRHGITIVETSAPKQTETTQRWKATLLVASLGTRQPTKVEFSRRRGIDAAAVEAVDREIVRPYAVTPFLAPHYAVAQAIGQKIEALASRPEPQARDVFDLDLLLARPDAPKTLAASATIRTKATENAIAISYDDYLAHVVAYLEPEHEPMYRSRDAWQRMQGDVVDRLVGAP